MTTHTPGPWTVSTHERHTTIEAPYFTIAVEVANCDAALIAAAPDLYEALKSMLASAGPGGHFEARAAIQKAEGGDNGR